MQSYADDGYCFFFYSQQCCVKWIDFCSSFLSYFSGAYLRIFIVEQPLKEQPSVAQNLVSDSATIYYVYFCINTIINKN